MSDSVRSKSQGQRIVALVGILLVAGGGLAYCTYQYFRKPGKHQPDKETPYTPGPRDEEGWTDYAAVLNDRLGKDVVPEKNANVLLWKTLGPTPGSQKEMPAEFFERLGIAPPPREGDYFTPLAAYLRKATPLGAEERNAIYEQERKAGQRPWSARDYPQVAAWLKADEKPLAVVLEASRRPEYFHPLACRRKENEPGTLVGALFPSVFQSRELASALTARALLRVEEGNFEAAWQDLLACHRLGRLVAPGGTLIETLVGIAIDQMAGTADLAFLDRAKLPSRKFQDLSKELQGLPPMPPLADKIDLGERFSFLDVLQLVRRRGFGILEALKDPTAPVQEPNAEERKTLEQIDWKPVQREGNSWFDRVAETLRHKDRARREKELARIEKDLEPLKAADENAALAALGKGPADQQTARAVGDLFIGSLGPGVRNLQNSYDRNEQTRRNLAIAFALAAYRADHERYPAGLAELAPKYLAAIPDDLFAGRALVYPADEKGYLLYSVGVNGQDEEGRSFDDNPPGDDLRVRLPLPDPKRPK